MQRTLHNGGGLPPGGHRASRFGGLMAMFDIDELERGDIPARLSSRRLDPRLRPDQDRRDQPPLGRLDCAGQREHVDRMHDSCRQRRLRLGHAHQSLKLASGNGNVETGRTIHDRYVLPD